MDLLYLLLLDVTYQLFQFDQTVSQLVVVYYFACRLEFYYHQLLPVLQGVCVSRCVLLVVEVLEEMFEYFDELALHEEISHCLDDIVVTASRQQHMIYSLLAKRKDNTDNEEPNDIEISQHLQDGIFR